ncbi:FAD:protein FMN transferase [Candidatus Moduliflexota bacterium]
MPIFSGCSGEFDVVRESRVVLGTVVQITLSHHSEEEARAAMERAFEEFERIDGVMSGYLPGSEVSKINREAAGGPVDAGSEVLALLGEAIDVSRESGGAFDITVGPLMELYRFDEGGEVPSSEDIGRALASVGHGKIDVDGERGTVAFSEEGVKIDLGGIGKGYAVDRAAAVLAAEGVTNAIIDAGGDLRLLGHRPGKDFWRIGIRHPREPGRFLLSIDLADRAVVTSGDYERFFMRGDERFHHLLDPSTGLPARGCQSVTVIARSTAAADAYATAAFVLGPERGLAYLRALEDVEGIIVDSDGEVLWTDRAALGQ